MKSPLGVVLATASGAAGGVASLALPGDAMTTAAATAAAPAEASTSPEVSFSTMCCIVSSISCWLRLARFFSFFFFDLDILAVRSTSRNSLGAVLTGRKKWDKNMHKSSRQKLVISSTSLQKLEGNQLGTCSVRLLFFLFLNDGHAVVPNSKNSTDQEYAPTISVFITHSHSNSCYPSFRKKEPIRWERVNLHIHTIEVI